MINIGIGISWVKALYSVAANIVANFRARVAADNGIFEAAPYLDVTLDELNAIGLLDKASLITTPNAYKESKLYSVVPSDGAGDMTVVRATTATRVNENGLIEVTPYNLFTYSEQFDNASWVKERITITTNATTAPNGTLTADKIVEDTTTNSHRVRQNQTSEQGIQYTLSYYLKASERTKARINVGGLNAFAFFDLSNGTIIGTPTLCTALIIDANNGWYRCSITYTQTSATSTAQLHLAATLNAAGDFIYLGDGVSGIFVWGAQLVTGTSAKEYFPTTDRLNIPRIDYTSGQGAILVEPQRTNLVTFSEQFDNASYSKTEMTVVANNAISPDGTQNADKLIPSTNASSHYLVKSISFSGVGSMSVYAKADGYNQLILLNSSGNVNFNLSSGTISSGPNGTIVSVGNGWYRCSVSQTFSNGTIYISCGSSTAASFFSGAGDGTSGVLLYGATLEAGSYATSYIPTVASTVTRNADVISKTGISSLIGQTEGTIFFNGKINSNTSTPRNITLSDGTASNRVILDFGNNGANRVECNLISGGVNQTSGLISIMDMTVDFKLAFSYATNSFKFFINGVKIAEDLLGTTFTGTTLNKLAFLTVSGTSQVLDGNVKQVQLYKEALTDEELILLTGDSFDTYNEMAEALNYTIQ